MKNKIILTSILAIVATCPVLADTNTATVDEGGDGNISAASTAENCSGAALTYNGTSYTSGTIEYTAQWQPNKYQITLDRNEANGGYRDSSPVTLYAVYNDHVYKTSNDADAGTNHMTTSTNGLASNPTGKTLNLQLFANAPGTHSDSEVTDMPADLNGTMLFEGFYANADPAAPGNQYINVSGFITSSGESVGINTANNQTWYAKYNCVKLGDPEGEPKLPGYRFNGWYTDEEGTTLYKNECVRNDQKAFASWTPNDYTVTYDCGAGSFVGGTPIVDTVTYDTTNYTFRAGSICSRSAYNFGSWSCTKDSPASGSYTPSNGVWQNDFSVTCTAQWNQNSINLEWYDGVSSTAMTGGVASCTVGTTGTITPIPVPTRTGYTFKGWKVTDHH